MYNLADSKKYIRILIVFIIYYGKNCFIIFKIPKYYKISSSFKKKRINVIF